ncbi:PTS lactose/cellobiose transporter subunit IIA [Propionispora vibrioides]|jgi:PTS system cellobiose-specific IIA component|uniref:PTS system, cellobiose-specific IIA component n=1 Tax=Propionispora vibrioides TaxID=112903 RepID=A0A1H8Y8C8_9FIRM|nr:PTS lactose/cellobiose transporter subunit IIA [Propionispora vibrioides]SEP47748.1 PTS system, cellobiose-specific IIA component [Propionispora vibrioides]
MKETENMEHLVMTIIVKSGEAKSSALEAIHNAKRGEIAQAKELLTAANESLGEAHRVQTGMIQAEAGGKKTEVSLLMVHAQDHLMTAMTVRDLAAEFVDLYARL